MDGEAGEVMGMDTRREASAVVGLLRCLYGRGGECVRAGSSRIKLLEKDMAMTGCGVRPPTSAASTLPGVNYYDRNMVSIE